MSNKSVGRSNPNATYYIVTHIESQRGKLRHFYVYVAWLLNRTKYVIVFMNFAIIRKNYSSHQNISFFYFLMKNMIFDELRFSKKIS